MSCRFRPVARIPNRVFTVAVPWFIPLRQGLRIGWRVVWGRGLDRAWHRERASPSSGAGQYRPRGTAECCVAKLTDNSEWSRPSRISKVIHRGILDLALVRI